jgi:dUTP pyrophosphatase
VSHLHVKISRLSSLSGDLPLPSYATEGSAGMDVCAAVDSEMILHAGETALVPTGLAIELPAGFEAQIRPRSGLAAKHQIGILNSPGTIDSDYRGEIKVILTNFGEHDFVIHHGDRIAQMVIAQYTKVEWQETASLENTKRGSGGFGHSGINHAESSTKSNSA